MKGVLIVDKPAGFTSFDVIAKLRKTLQMKRIGHGGTLDPEATGVLVVFIGEATRLCDYFPDSDKTYEAEMTLGIATDTEDIWGQVTETLSVNVSEEQVQDVLESFCGPYLQTPPMVSAKKVDGKKLYEYARQGIEIRRKPEEHMIYDLSVLEMDLPRVRFRVSVSKGTYIRTLCTDAGKKLGLPACMSALRRTVQGRFSIEDARTLEEICACAAEGRIKELILPVERLFECPEVRVTETGEKRLFNGNPLKKEEIIKTEDGCPENEIEDLIKVFDRTHTLRGIYRFDAGKDLYVPEKMFLGD